jgi:hypothetical protein
MGHHEREFDFTRLRIEELRKRTLELERRNRELADQEELAGSSPDQVQRAAELAERARVHANAAHIRASEAYMRSAAAHDAAADRHDLLAAGGFGDVDEHRQRAHAHRQMAAIDRDASTASGMAAFIGEPDSRSVTPLPVSADFPD